MNAPGLGKCTEVAEIKIQSWNKKNSTASGERNENHRQIYGTINLLIVLVQILWDYKKKEQ